MWMFNSDYTEGAHENILNALVATNYEQTTGYGEDTYCAKAAALIKEACDAPKAAVHFLVGGTQTNFTVISSALRPHQGVLSAESGHIFAHETGAVEACGHKVMILPSHDGKITAAQVAEVCEQHKADASFEHTVQPKMVYLSNPTEWGTIYYKKEVEELAATCKKYDLYLFMDGARLGYGLTAENNDLTLADLARLCDVFYIGGTKMGALFGEAVVISNPVLQKDFRYIMKQKGAMLAKGRLLGLQFIELFSNNLYFTLGRHANVLAAELKQSILQLGFTLYLPTTTNQLFVEVPNVILEKMQKKYAYSYMQKINEKTSLVRLCTSWATKKEAVEELKADLEQWSKELG